MTVWENRKMRPACVTVTTHCIHMPEREIQPHSSETMGHVCAHGLSLDAHQHGWSSTISHDCYSLVMSQTDHEASQAEVSDAKLHEEELRGQGLIVVHAADRGACELVAIHRHPREGERRSLPRHVQGCHACPFAEQGPAVVGSGWREHPAS